MVRQHADDGIIVSYQHRCIALKTFLFYRHFLVPENVQGIRGIKSLTNGQWQAGDSGMNDLTLRRKLGVGGY